MRVRTRKRICGDYKPSEDLVFNIDVSLMQGLFEIVLVVRRPCLAVACLNLDSCVALVKQFLQVEECKVDGRRLVQWHMQS